VVTAVTRSITPINESATIQRNTMSMSSAMGIPTTIIDRNIITIPITPTNESATIIGNKMPMIRTIPGKISCTICMHAWDPILHLAFITMVCLHISSDTLNTEVWRIQ
jgi:uncharacterized membrane protein